MYKDALTKACANVKTKNDLLKTAPLKYFILSILAGFYIGLAVYLIYAIAAPFYADNFPGVRIITGLGFTVGLTFVVFAGSELFTGNILFFTIALIKKKTSPLAALKTLGVCLFGNLAGAALFCLILRYTYLLDTDTGEFIYQAAITKINLAPVTIITRALLCNMLVCLALWMGLRASLEITKIIFIIICIFTFVASGYIHCIADMTHLWLASLTSESLVTPGAYLYVIVCGIAGNTVGGAIIGAAYAYIGE